MAYRKCFFLKARFIHFFFSLFFSFDSKLRKRQSSALSTPDAEAASTSPSSDCSTCPHNGAGDPGSPTSIAQFNKEVQVTWKTHTQPFFDSTKELVFFFFVFFVYFFLNFQFDFCSLFILYDLVSLRDDQKSKVLRKKKNQKNFDNDNLQSRSQLESYDFCFFLSSQVIFVT
jgi:hypothetical protein